MIVIIILTILLGCLVLIALFRFGNDNNADSSSEAVNDKYLDRSSVVQDTRLITETVNKPRESINIRKDLEPECRATEENEDKIYGNRREMEVNRTNDDKHLPMNQDIENDNLSDKNVNGSLPVQEKRLSAGTINKQRESVNISNNVNLEGREENEEERYGNISQMDVNQLNDDEIVPSSRDNIRNENPSDVNLDGSLPVQEQSLSTEAVNNHKKCMHISKDEEPEDRATKGNDDNRKIMEVNWPDDENVPGSQDDIENKNLSKNKLDVSLHVQDTRVIAETVNEEKESIKISKDVDPQGRATEANENKRCVRSDEDKNVPSNQDTAGNINLSVENIDGSSDVNVHHTILSSVTVNEESKNKDGEYEGKATEDRLLKVLNILNLTKKYPGRLSREEMYQITKSSLHDELPKCYGELASYFIHKLVKYNYTAREFSITRSENEQGSAASTDTKGSSSHSMRNRRAKEKRGLDISPMDIIIAVFLCCDNICKQDLVSHMWSCRLAIPLVVQEQEPPILPSCFLWPLRNLVMKWETQHNGKTSVREGRLINECITSIAFIRVGEIGLSKSALINNVISVSEKAHSIFFHKGSLGSTRHRYLVDGLIDISWYFPMLKSEGNSDNYFKDAVIFLNLHGDANELQRYLPVLSKLANIISVLCKVNYLDSCRKVIQSYLDMGNTVLLIITDQEIQDDDIIQDFVESFRVANDQLEYLEAAELQQAELAQETRSLLIKLGKGKSVCLDKVCSSDIGVTVDETTAKFLNTKKEVIAISTLLRKTPYQERKSLFLFLQGDPWMNWAEADKEKFRITNKNNNQGAEIYMAGKDETMKECRSQQREFLKKENISLADMFLKSVSLLNSEDRKLFLRWLKFEIDDLSRDDLGPIYDKYQKIAQSLAGANEPEKKKLKSTLKDLDNKIALCSFGLENIMREIGQIYEALHLCEPKHPLLKHNLPELAANILLDGFPFELYDGYVNAVPIQWVTAVLRSLDHILRKQTSAVRIKVLSALGIQSSGKSTMLNALFGCQYAVSAGRCTRGLYCQLIKVEETYRKELEIDYILAVDTEGLQAPELSASGQMVKHDNELATFVIGLGDLTILNLMGENTTCINDFLPISVHAFLRMEMITHFKPKCKIVHQNVNKEDEQKLLYQGRILEDNLDTMTKMACNVEKTEPKSFKDIIEFDVSKDVYYLPALLEGSRPMAPISTRYSDELNTLKQHLVEKDPGKHTNTLASFINHLHNLWSAIKKDDFAYQFRNTIETEARSKLNNYWCEANWKFKETILNILQKGYIQIENTKNVNELNVRVKELEDEVRTKTNSEHLVQKSDFSKFISEADPLLKETMKKWSVNMDKSIDDLRTELLRDMTEKLREFKECRKRKFSLNDNISE